MPNRSIPYKPYLKILARELRNNSTPAEATLWNKLKNKQSGYDFHRQKPLRNYIVDFYSAELNLIIEIDGQYHSHEEQYTLDIRREDELKVFGLTILRFSEMEVRKNMINVLRVLEDYIENFKIKKFEY